MFLAAIFENIVCTTKNAVGIHRHLPVSKLQLGNLVAVIPEIEAKIRQLRKKRIGQLQIARTLGLGTGTVRRVVREAAWRSE